MTPSTITQVAALIAAITGATAAIAAVLNLRLSIRRERPALSVFLRQWATGPQGSERYIEVVASNIGHRPVTVVTMGLRMQATSEQGRSWRVDDGGASPPLPATLGDGETVAMTWLRDELGRAFWEGEAVVVACFAQDGRGKEVLRSLPEPLG